MAAQSIVAHFPMAMDASSTDDNIIYSSWYAVNSNVGILSFTSVIADQTIRITVPLYGATIKGAYLKTIFLNLDSMTLDCLIPKCTGVTSETKNNN